VILKHKSPKSKVKEYMMNINKIYKIKSSLISVGFILCTVVSMPSNAQNVEPWTGAAPGSNLNFSEGDIINDIRNRLNKGEVDDAVRMSQRYVDRLESGRRDGQTNSLIYDAYNALCISLTAAGNYDEAMDACNFAINQSPKRWQSVNSRGSLNYKTGKYADALNDYRNALDLAPKGEQITRIIEHNVKITQAKLAAN